MSKTTETTVTTPSLTLSPAWLALVAHQRVMGAVHLRELFAGDAGRFGRFSLQIDNIFLDYSKHRINDETLKLLLALARQAKVSDWIARLFAGDLVNNTENRAALHMALRSDHAIFPEQCDVMPAVREVRQRMAVFATALRKGQLLGATGKPIRDIVNLGVGGSDLGPRMAVRALRPYTGAAMGGNDIRVHFVSNVDPSDLDAVLTGLAPATTLFIIASKTFTTVETLTNARRARAWLATSLGDTAALSAHLAAVSAATEKAAAFGVMPERTFPMWDWVGGRYSLWSAVGLPIAIAAGPAAFEALLKGARDVDAHFTTAPLDRNMPVLMALLSLWYSAFFGAQTHAVLPYSEDLREFPDYLQQLQMESNGKRVNRDGLPVNYPTSPVLWGGAGTVSQHSFHQLLLQGRHLIPVDFVIPIRCAKDGDADAQRLLVANALAQGAALMGGVSATNPHHSSPGNGPSSTLMIERLTPQALGALIALYEHKVFVESILLNINPFDQWGVELGKTLARAIEHGEPGDLDPSTLALVERTRIPE